MTTWVEMKNDDQMHNDFKKGEKGYIDGYVRGGNNTPFACVVIEDRIVLCPLHALKAERRIMGKNEGRWIAPFRI